MGEHSKLTNLNAKPTSADALKLIDEVQKDLEHDYAWQWQNQIDAEEKATLEILSDTLKGAKVIVHKDGEGATVLSSTGAIINIGETPVLDKYESMTKSQKLDYDFTLNQTLYAIGEAAEVLKSDGIVTKEEKEKLYKLDEILKDVSIIVTDDGKGIIVADSDGRHFEIDNTTKTQDLLAQTKATSHQR